MTPFRGYLKIKIKEGYNESFHAIIPTFVELVKDSEPDVLQFEAFANDDTGEIIWLESYRDNAGFDTHISNPKLDDLKMEMMPMQESITNMFFMSQPTESSLAFFRDHGIEPVVLSPWPGTTRLTEERDASGSLQTVVLMELSDLDQYREISERVEDAASRQPGVLFHCSYQLDDHHMVVLEEYKDSNSLINWAKVFGENAGNFNSLVRSFQCEVCGTPTDAGKKMLDGWGGVYFRKIAGFKRFD